jgi:VanZ family protein
VKKKSDQPFYLARLTFVVYLCLVSYASLTPFNFSFGSHLVPWLWVSAPIPKYIPTFDVLSNIIGYLPFGFLMIFSLYPQSIKWRAFLVCLLMGSIFSGILESLQTYLPTRIPSNIDWVLNIIGVVIGSLFALPLSPQWLSGNKAERIRESIFGHHQEFFLMMVLCLFAQIFPQNAWLGMGDLGLSFTRISPYWTLPLSNVSQEILITSIATLGLGSFFLFGMKKEAAPLKIISLFILVMLVLKFLVSQFQFGSASWWSASIIIGMIIGYILTFLAQLFSRNILWGISLFNLCSLIILVNVLPHNPYFFDVLEQLPQGKMMHFNGLFEWISIVWPFLAIAILFKNRKIQTL